VRTAIGEFADTSVSPEKKKENLTDRYFGSMERDILHAEVIQNFK